MKALILLIFILVSTLSSGSSVRANDDVKENDQAKEGQGRRIRFQTVNMTRSVSEVLLPESLWEKIEEVYRPQALGTVPKGKGKFGSKIEISTKFIPLKVFLMEKNFGGLGGTNYELVFGEGGGELDLKSFVRKQKRTFFLSIVLGEEFNKEDMKVYFLSNSIKREIGHQSFGSGCNKFLDISSFYQSVIKDEGVEVNTSDYRYLSVLGGSFFFAIYKEKQLYLAQLTITDSRYTPLLCRN